MAEERYLGSRVYESLARRLGIGVTTWERVESVTTDGCLLLNPNPRRFQAVIVNHGLSDITVGLSMQIAQSTGMYIPRQGGMLILLIDEDLELPTYGWYAVSRGSPCNVYVLEVIGQ